MFETLANMNQHEFVDKCYAEYSRLGLTPGNPDDGDWEDAHYPAPKCAGGTEVIWLLHEDHQVQGLLQSEEYERMCFFPHDVKTFLENDWCQEWFEVYGLYEKWVGDNGKGSFAKIPKETLIDNGKKTGPANGKNFPSHIRSSNGRATGTANLANVSKETLSDNGKVNMANMPKETLVANGKANAKSVNSQRWRCLVTGHISNPGGLSTYQRARGINTSLRVRISN